MSDETADALREMALHRGLKLVRSRRRKPGTGDFGKFGLTDGSGHALIGIGEEGLTATASDIEDFLRAGTANTWQESAKITQARNAAQRQERSKSASDAPTGPSRQSAGTARRSGTDRRAKASRPRSHDAPSPARGRRSSPEGRASGQARQSRTPAASPATAPATPPKVGLELRAAKPGDADDIASLMRMLPGKTPSVSAIAARLAAIHKAGGGASLAAMGEVVGCVAWVILPTLHHGPVGRIILLIVNDRHRRRGIGAKLLAEAERALSKKGCTLLEAMSDIDLKNSHGFFRARGFAQASYRFVRPLETNEPG